MMLEQNMSLTTYREENSCENIFASLIEVLKKELDLYGELKDTIIREKTILFKPSLEDLNHINSLKENIILKSRMLEEVRTKILKKIARIIDINLNDVRLSQVAKYAGPEQQNELKEIQDSLVLISQEINALNAANKDLLNASMNNIKSSLDFINSLMSSGSVYLQCGKMKSANKNGMYLNKKG